MKKKTYKQMQNRLYREIKRRIIAENRNTLTANYIAKSIDTLAVRQIIERRTYLCVDESVIKRNIAHMITDKLYDENYFEFHTKDYHFMPVTDTMEIECRIRVVKPEEDIT